MKENTYKAIMLAYSKNYTHDTYNLYNSETKRLVRSRDNQWKEWKIIIWRKPWTFYVMNEKDLGSGIKEVVDTGTTPT